MGMQTHAILERGVHSPAWVGVIGQQRIDVRKIMPKPAISSERRTREAISARQK